MSHPAGIEGLLGADCCRGGWFVVESDTTLRGMRFRVHARASDFLQMAAIRRKLAILDMPIGLSNSRPRACDVAARKLLGQPRASSVFPAPCRAALDGADYEDACRRSLNASGVKLSKQLFAMFPKLKSVDEIVTPELQAHIREAHPEVVFAVLSGKKTGLEFNKRTAEGQAERLKILRRFLPGIDPKPIRDSLGASVVAIDDILDACACLIAAHRALRGKSFTLPEGLVEMDSRGLRMEMVS